MSKGSTRRPQQEADDVVDENWRRIFGQKQEQEPAEDAQRDS